MTTRRGWRERLDAGIYRAHRVSCPRSADKRPRSRCGCPLSIQVPGVKPGTSRTVTLPGDTPLSDAKKAKGRLRAQGRPEPVVTPEVGTVHDLAVRYFRARAPRSSGGQRTGLKPSTFKGYNETYRLRIAGPLGGSSLATLSRPDVVNWIDGMEAAGASPHAVRKALRVLSVMLSFAVERDIIAVNPATGVKLAQAVEREERPTFTKAELSRLLEAAGSLRAEVMLRLAAEAGLRKGEIVGLRWPDLDLPARRLEVRRSVWQERAGEGAPARKIVGTPKSGKARRVALTRMLTKRLGELFTAEVIEGGADAEGWIFRGRSGDLMDERTPYAAALRAQVRAGLVTAEGKPRLSFHDLRHCAASIPLSEGAPLIAVSRQLGHSDVKITASIYAHLVDDSHLDRALVGLEGPEEAADDAGHDAGPSALATETARDPLPDGTLEGWQSGRMRRS